MIEPHTESDPIAILVQYLASFANAVGPGPITGSRAIDISLLNAVLAADTSKSRKGTSAGRVREIFKIADEEWEFKLRQKRAVLG